mmetsp:Transcript_29986/g.75613  ORF Transcript_29986/g.75613 Transcript_29986/m.75613 type:complete len:211 (-) Transcript_29986:1921-2553(-)
MHAAWRGGILCRCSRRVGVVGPHQGGEVFDHSRDFPSVDIGGGTPHRASRFLGIQINHRPGRPSWRLALGGGRQSYCSAPSTSPWNLGKGDPAELYIWIFSAQLCTQGAWCDLCLAVARSASRPSGLGKDGSDGRRESLSLPVGSENKPHVFNLACGGRSLADCLLPNRSAICVATRCSFRHEWYATCFQPLDPRSVRTRNRVLYSRGLE